MDNNMSFLSRNFNAGGGISPIKHVHWLPTYGCLCVLYPFKMISIMQGSSTYRFNVFGMNLAGIWTTDLLVHALTITPPSLVRNKVVL